MRLALQTDFALRTLIYLAANPGRAKIGEIAEFYAISAHHVAKAVHTLVRNGYVRGLRGLGGGIELALAADDIRVGDVILQFEGNLHLLECVGTLNVCVIQPNCRLRFHLAEAERLFSNYLNTITLRDLVEPGEELVKVDLLAER